ncbi:MAG: CotH kinase family protein, partial [Clostridia bacterium]|nr:CotH kinase family protein [Clostridia bacterium]
MGTYPRMGRNAAREISAVMIAACLLLCTACGLADHVHGYKETVVAPDCVNGGYTLHRCSCGDEYKDSFTDPLGHDFDEEVLIEPTCEGEGKAKRICKVCGYTDEAAIPPAGHRFAGKTCDIKRSGSGLKITEHGDCTVCGKTGLLARSVRVRPGISENGRLDSFESFEKCGKVSAEWEDGKLTLLAFENKNYKFLGWSDGSTEDETIYDGTEDVYAVFGYESHAMPVVSINTEGSQQVVFRDHYIGCEITVSNCDDRYIKDKAAGKIRVRGNASSNYGDPEYAKYNKVHYRIKFDKKASFLGLNGGAECKSWVLLRGDENFLREPLSFKLFTDITQGAYYASDYTYVQVFINHEYYGAYVLCEQTQIQKNRISIAEKKDGDTELRTGYLVEIDHYYGSEEYHFEVDYGGVRLTDMYGVTRTARKAGYSVKYDVMTDEQLKFVSRYVRNVYTVVYKAIYEGEFFKLDGDNNLDFAPEFKNAEECVANVLDLDAAAAMYISREVACERDGGVGSFFMYVDFTADHPRLTFCSPWDYSWAYGTGDGFAMEHLWVSAFQPPEFAYAGDRSFTWFITLYKSDFFKRTVKEKWKDMTSRGVQEALLAEIDRVAETYSEDFAMNSKRWGTGNQADSAAYIKEFLRKRMEWLDTQWK